MEKKPHANMALLPLSTLQVNNVESLLTKHREFYHSNNSVSGENTTTHCPIRRMLNARKCLLNKHLITLNKTVRVTADLLPRKGRLFTAPPGAYCFLFNADKCKSFTVPQQPGVEQLSRKIKLVPYDLFTQRWMKPPVCHDAFKLLVVAPSCAAFTWGQAHH